MRRTWLSLGLCTAVGFTLIVMLDHQARLPRTHRDAVIQVLEAREVRYRRVAIYDSCPLDARDCAQLGNYTADVEVVGERQSYGKIVCRERREHGGWGVCTLDLPNLALHSVLLPELATEPSWIRSWATALRQVEARVRGWVR